MQRRRRVTKLVRDFPEPLVGPGGRYFVRVYAERCPDGHWEGWVELVADSGDVVMTGRETTQPDLKAMRYWASRLRPAYLAGALERARRRFGVPVSQRWVV